jgi:hypothetical protein
MLMLVALAHQSLRAHRLPGDEAARAAPPVSGRRTL